MTGNESQVLDSRPSHSSEGRPTSLPLASPPVCPPPQRASSRKYNLLPPLVVEATDSSSVLHQASPPANQGPSGARPPSAKRLHSPPQTSLPIFSHQGTRALGEAERNPGGDEEIGSDEEWETIEIPDITPRRQVQGPDKGLWGACLHQCGLYPDKPNHQNQDCGLMHPSRCGAYSQFLSVMDGHGPEGHHVAHFVAEHLPRVADSLLKKTEPVGALVQAHKVVQQMLAHESGIDTRFSGTTAVSVWMSGRDMLVSNVGDSRAVLGRRSAGSARQWVAMDLTKDQTPFRPDERARVQAAGARIKTSCEMSGDKTYAPGCQYTADDPPRCYLQQHRFPGTAFTRSLGDTVAKTIGVVATPEIMAYSLTPHDDFMVVASDGLWEFVSSQEVVDITSSCGTPEEAAHKLVETAWDLWLTEDVRADDITVIVVFLESGKMTAKGTLSSSEVFKERHSVPNLLPLI